MNMEQLGELLRQFLAVYTVLCAATVALVVVLLAVSVRQIRRMNLPPDADFVTALRATPLAIVLVLDLLDFTFDFLSIPIAWVLLTALGLGPLRIVTAVEAFIPGTQMIPTMTLAWFSVRLLRPKPPLRNDPWRRQIEVVSGKPADNAVHQAEAAPWRL